MSSKNFATWSILFRYTALLPGIGFRRPVIQPHSLTFAGEAHGDDVRGDVGEVEVVAVHLEEMLTLLAKKREQGKSPGTSSCSPRFAGALLSPGCGARSTGEALSQTCKEDVSGNSPMRFFEHT